MSRHLQPAPKQAGASGVASAGARISLVNGFRRLVMRDSARSQGLLPSLQQILSHGVVTMKNL
jgi:hypothetical protein